MRDEFYKQVALRGDRRDARSRADLVSRLRREFQALAGMTLTVPQAMRLVGIDSERCHRVLAELVHDGVIVRLSDGRYACKTPTAAE
jgi:DNA-binding IclR family transcriptional regulator